MFLFNNYSEKFFFVITLFLILFGFGFWAMLYIALAWGVFDDEDMEKALDAMKQDIISGRFKDYYTPDEDTVEFGSLYEMLIEMIMEDPEEGVDLNDKYIMSSELEDDMEIEELERLLGLHHDLLENERSLYIDIELRVLFKRAKKFSTNRPFFDLDPKTFWD